MDVISQLPGCLLCSSSQITSPSLAVDAILHPVSLATENSASDYFTGVDFPSSDLPTAMNVSYIASETVSPLVGQYFDQDFLGDMGQVWSNFVESGQLWALLFGIVIGYMIRNLTAF